jgi:hypothetical protein
MLHIIARWHSYELLGNDCGQFIYSFPRVDQVVSVVFSNAKDEARSYHKHLEERDELKNTPINLSFHAR